MCRAHDIEGNCWIKIGIPFVFLGGIRVEMSEMELRDFSFVDWDWQLIFGAFLDVIFLEGKLKFQQYFMQSTPRYISRYWGNLLGKCGIIVNTICLKNHKLWTFVSNKNPMSGILNCFFMDYFETIIALGGNLDLWFFWEILLKISKIDGEWLQRIFSLHF